MSKIKNNVVAQRFSHLMWTIAGTEEGSADYLLYAQALDDDWWEFFLVQLGSEMEHDYFVFDVEVFRARMYAREQVGVRATLKHMAESLVSDQTDITNPVDFVEQLGGEIVQFGPMDQLWH